MFRRPAANFPGKVAQRIDPQLIADLAPRIREKSIVVVGTNGKTTVTNLLADAFEQAGKTVACNRTGANMVPGVATTLLHTRCADWGVFESDELWLAKILPQLRPAYVVLLNLFRDQLDRMGEIDHIQESIAAALASSPGTTLVYNTDDPLCRAIAMRVENPTVSFGVDGELGLSQNTVADAGMCQQCESVLVYEWRQYGQLGKYRCTYCGFTREDPLYAARDVELQKEAAAFTFHTPSGDEQVSMSFSGAYMVYNALALYTAASLCGLPPETAAGALRSFDPKNGRLQSYIINGHSVLLNLAKNPTGFNQNLKIVLQDTGPKAVAFFINDKDADGHDVSWLWDIDFEELADAGNLQAYAGGIRRNDMQVRLKCAGIDAQLVDDAEDFFMKAWGSSPNAACYLIANYTALSDVKATLDRLQNALGTRKVQRRERMLPTIAIERMPGRLSENSSEQLVLMHMYPTLLNLYGDGGNVSVLAERARRRGIDVEVVRIDHGQAADFEHADIVFLGGGPDREQHLASRDLLVQADELRAYVEDDGVLLAICGGYQIIGREWLMGEEVVPGLGIVDITTRRAEGGSHDRLVGNIVLDSPLAKMPVVGYENHAGRTFLGEDCEPFGHVVGTHGKGNNDADKADGVLYRNVVGTYLHGPLLAKNPEIADYLIERALARRAIREGRPMPELAALDDSAERAANEFMRARLGCVPRK